MDGKHDSTGKAVVVFALVIGFVVMVIIGIAHPSKSSQLPPDPGVPGFIQWSTVTCHNYEFAGETVEECVDGNGLSVEPALAHSYGITADN